MTENLVATSVIDIDAPPDRVWAALVDPIAVKEFMFGTELVTDWQEGSPIAWRGEWEGRPYEDHGEILRIAPGELLKVTHFSPLSGQPDEPENYHTLTYELSPTESGTRLSLSQDNNPDEAAVEHSTGMWDSLVAGIKEYVEARES